MLRQNIELLKEVSKKYQSAMEKTQINLSRSEKKRVEENLKKFKKYIKFLTSNINEIVKEEESKIKEENG